jgi:histidinol phosphatase-like enzyme (inositol monophosphatase family)
MQDFSSFARLLADQAGEIARHYFRQELAIDIKADNSPVTRADREIEQCLRSRISIERPDDGIFGEEYGEKVGRDGATWVIDPIDGTKSFITGLPLFGTLIGLLRGGVPVAGMIAVPVLDERWEAENGEARLNGRPCRTSRCRTVAEACLYTTSPDSFAGPDLATFAGLASGVRLQRFGGDCYAYGLLASGHIDLVVEAGLQPYDYLPIVPIVIAAGGCMTDWQGRPLTLRSDGRVVASASADLHAEAVRKLAAAR